MQRGSNHDLCNFHMMKRPGGRLNYVNRGTTVKVWAGHSGWRFFSFQHIWRAPDEGKLILGFVVCRYGAYQQNSKQYTLKATVAVVTSSKNS